MNGDIFAGHQGAHGMLEDRAIFGKNNLHILIDSQQMTGSILINRVIIGSKIVLLPSSILVRHSILL